MANLSHIDTCTQPLRLTDRACSLAERKGPHATTDHIMEFVSLFGPARHERAGGGRRKHTRARAGKKHGGGSGDYFFYRGLVDELPCIMVADFHPMMSSGVLGEIQPVKGCLGRAWLILCSSPAKHVLHSLHPPPQRAQLPDTRTRMLGGGRAERQRLQWKSRRHRMDTQKKADNRGW